MRLELPLKSVGSNELHEQVLNDIESLILRSNSRKFRPLILVVGPLFIEVGAAQTLVQDLNIPNWEQSVLEFKGIMTELLLNKRLSIMKMCETKNGEFAQESIKGMSVFFDPDEEYLSLRCVDTNTKGSDKDPTTKDGYLIVTLRFRREEILPDFVIDIPDIIDIIDF